MSCVSFYNNLSPGIYSFREDLFLKFDLIFSVFAHIQSPSPSNLCNSEVPVPRGHAYQVWLKLVQHFQRICSKHTFSLYNKYTGILDYVNKIFTELLDLCKLYQSCTVVSIIYELIPGTCSFRGEDVLSLT